MLHERKVLRSALVQQTASFVDIKPRFGVGEYSDQKEFTIFYIGNKEGQVYKVAQWTQDGKLKYVWAESTISSVVDPRSEIFT